MTKSLLTPRFFRILKRYYSTDRPYSTTLSLIDISTNEDVFEDKTMKAGVAAKDYSNIPGPKALPIIGNAWRFAPIIGHYKIHELDKVMISLYQQYGKIVKVGGLIGHPDLLFVFDGDDIQRVFKMEEIMPHRPSMPSLHYYKQHLQKDFFHGNEGVIGVSVMAVEGCSRDWEKGDNFSSLRNVPIRGLRHGPKWDAFRKQVQHILLSPTTAKTYIEPLDLIATDFLKRMEDMLDENQELPGNFLHEIYKWALESVARISLNTRLGCLEPLSKDSESQRIIESINTFFWNVAEVELKMPVWRIYENKAFRKYIQALEDFRTLCLKYIQHCMYQMKDKNYDNIKEENISIVEMILLKTKNPKVAAVLALDLFLVGVDTIMTQPGWECFKEESHRALRYSLLCLQRKQKTALFHPTHANTSVAVASTMYQLSQNMDKQQKLFEELKEALPNQDSKVTVAAQEKMTYLKACIKETLRMYPVIIGNGRSLQSDTVIRGYKVPKGTHVIFPHLLVSNSEQYFEEPDKFIPERWLKNDADIAKCPHQKKIHRFVSLPFGYGRRSCLGRRFAEVEMNTLLSKMFRKYKIDYNYGKLTYKVSPTYFPEQPLKFKLTKRTI